MNTESNVLDTRPTRPTTAAVAALWLSVAAPTVALPPAEVPGTTGTTAAGVPGTSDSSGAGVPGTSGPSETQPATEGSAWAHLEALREALVASGGSVADFVQDFVPAGFTSGDRESGRLYLALPACLRWDYEIPYPKSFLLCDELLYFWNQGEASGRRIRVDAQNEPGLDLLLLSVPELRQRYHATTTRQDPGTLELSLEPTSEVGSIARATLGIDPTAGRVLTLSWSDREGNRTTFSFSGHRALAERGRFTPPTGISWEDGEAAAEP